MQVLGTSTYELHSVPFTKGLSKEVGRRCFLNKIYSICRWKKHKIKTLSDMSNDNQQKMTL